MEEITGLGPADGRPLREEKFQPDIRQRFICFELSGQMDDSPGKFCLGTTEIHTEMLSDGPVLKNPPCSAGDSGLIPRAMDQLSPHATARVCTAVKDPTGCNEDPARSNQDPTQPNK